MTKDCEYTTVPTDNSLRNTHKLPRFGIRHVQVLLCFTMVVIALGSNIILSITIVAMTTNSGNPYNLKHIGLIHSAFFGGYIIPQVVAGVAAAKFGSKRILLVSMLVQSLLGFCTPFAVKLGSIELCISRALQGFCQGFLFPCITQQLSRWVPTNERSRLGAFVFGGAPLGIVLGMILSGIITASTHGWALVFHFYGLLGVIWCVAFGVFGSDSPIKHKTIKEAERVYVQGNASAASKKHKIPWFAIIKSTPVWALLAAQFGYVYCTSTFFSQIPTYLNRVMEFDIKSNGFLSALPFLVCWISSFGFSICSDAFINFYGMSIGCARKIFNSIGLLGSSTALLLLAFTNKEDTLQGVVLLVSAMGVISACTSGWSVNHIDLSPKHAGTIMGITNSISHISAILAPLTVQYFTKDQNTLHEWRMVFVVAALVATLCCMIFNIWGSGDIQTWDNSTEDCEFLKKEANKVTN